MVWCVVPQEGTEDLRGALYKKRMQELEVCALCDHRAALFRGTHLRVWVYSTSHPKASKPELRRSWRAQAHRQASLAPHHRAVGMRIRWVFP